MKNLVQSILQVIGICIFWILFFLTIFNNLAVRELRYCAESHFYNECNNNCAKRDFPACNREDYNKYLRDFCISQNIGVCNLSCSVSARDWRDAYIDLAFDNIIKQITGGLAITTANMLDGTIGSIAFVVKFIKNGQRSGYFNGCRGGGRYSNNLSDITIFSDFVLKTGLYYKWHYAGCYRDLLSKHIAKSDRSFCFFHFEDFIRVATNIFVCIVFICLAIRIFSFNFRDGIFEIIRGKK